MATINTINVSVANDGNGDTLRNAFVKANDNFAELNSKKVEAELGKGLSENDFTDADKAKLDSALQPDDISTSLTETVTGKVADATVSNVLNDRIGDLSILATTNKSSTVNAINEVRNNLFTDTLAYADNSTGTQHLPITKGQKIVFDSAEVTSVVGGVKINLDSYQSISVSLTLTDAHKGKTMPIVVGGLTITANSTLLNEFGVNVFCINGVTSTISIPSGTTYMDGTTTGVTLSLAPLQSARIFKYNNIIYVFK